MVGFGSVKFTAKYPKVAATVLWRHFNVLREPPYSPSGIDIHEQDWDVLLILDACRYDVFESHHTIDGTLSQVYSRGSASEEWVRGNFTDREYGDLVIVSSNPFYKLLADDIGIRVHHFEWVGPNGNSEIVPEPDAMTEAVLEVADRFPNKRILAHYMQPHAPYFGPSGDVVEMGDEHLHKAVKRSSASKEQVWNAYLENFNLVQKSITPVIEEVVGKKVVSSDHGELLGEPLFRRLEKGSFYGHPYACHHDSVRLVPWLEVPCQERREIKTEHAVPISEANEKESVKEQLRALGYVQ